MSKYTTEVRFICEQLSGLESSVGYADIDAVITAAIPKIFDFDFPIFDENYRSVLCRKILMHYYLREIGVETYGLWKHFLRTRLNEIMPYYNKLYESAQFEFDPLHDVDITVMHSGSGSQENTSSVSEDGKTTIMDSVLIRGDEQMTGNDVKDDKYSATPQGTLINVQNDTYLTDFREIVDNTTGYREFETSNAKNGSTDTTKTTSNQFKADNTDQYINHTYGKTAGHSYAKLIKEFRDTIINVDTMIISDLNTLFINIW